MTGFVFYLLMLVLMGIVLYRNTVEFQAGAVRQQHAITVTNSLEKILALAVDAETAVRGYTLMGEDPFPEPYRTAVNDVNQEIEHLRALTRDESDQLPQVNKLEPLMKEKTSARTRSKFAGRGGLRQSHKT